MGYTSDVGIKCEEQAYKMFRDAYQRADFYPSRLFKNKYNEYLMVWSWVKWYKDLSDVRAIEEVMSILDDEFGTTDGYGYKFIRLGESDCDVEERQNDCEIEFYFVRSFDTVGMDEL